MVPADASDKKVAHNPLHSKLKSKGEKRKRIADATRSEPNSILTERNKSKEGLELTESRSKIAKNAPAETTQTTQSLPATTKASATSNSSEAFRREHQVLVTGVCDSGEPYACSGPMTAFSMTPFAKPIRKALESAGFKIPTPTQAQVWPIALAGRDIITVAKTGSGKTCAFLLPAFHRLLTCSKDRKRGQPAILVLAPTRELACQIEDECVKFGKTSDIRSCCAYGGAPKSLQVRKIQGGIEVLIATPGRLNDLLEINVVDLSEILFLVLDEADRMLDLGFEPQIRKIISKLLVKRQSMMFTATWPKEVRIIAKDFLISPIEIKFGDSEQLNANKAITQTIRVILEKDKTNELKRVLQSINPGGVPDEFPKTIIFVARKKICDSLGNEMWNAGFPVDSLHGDKEQAQRTKVMDNFKKSEIRVLVATDVAARGLDVKDIEVVINYDFPVGGAGVEDYVHRIGRTARGGASGQAFTFFTTADAKSANELISVLQRAEQQVPPGLIALDRGLLTDDVKGGGGKGGGGKGGGGGSDGGGKGRGTAGGKEGGGGGGGRGNSSGREGGGRGGGGGRKGGEKGRDGGRGGGRGRGGGGSGRGRGRGGVGRGGQKR